MKAKVTGETIFNLLIALVFVGFFVGSLRFPPAAKSFPIVVTVPGIILSAWVVIAGLRSDGEKPEVEKALTSVQRNRLYAMLVSFAGLLVLIYLLGMPIGFALFGFGFMRFISRRSWAMAVGTAVFGFFLIWGLFGQIMHFQPYPGVFKLFGG